MNVASFPVCNDAWKYKVIFLILIYITTMRPIISEAQQEEDYLNLRWVYHLNR